MTAPVPISWEIRSQVADDTWRTLAHGQFSATSPDLAALALAVDLAEAVRTISEELMELP